MVTEVVGAETVGGTSGPHSGLPRLRERRSPERTTAGAGEQGSVGFDRAVGAEVRLERLDDEGGEGHHPSAGCRLRRELEPPGAGHLLGLLARKVDVTDLIGSAEIAHRLGAKRPELIHDWRRRHPDFPQPVAWLRIGLVWAWPDVERWAKSTGRLPETRG